jgi:hypothetical protein
LPPGFNCDKTHFLTVTVVILKVTQMAIEERCLQVRNSAITCFPIKYN